jgi:hypothetical protein
MTRVVKCAMLWRTWTMRLTTKASNEARVYLTRRARAALDRLEPVRQAALSAAFLRVGQELLDRAEQVQVVPAWSRRTWPRRHYPQQCYPRTVKYIRQHADIPDMRLVHGVISHSGGGVPLDHAWVELPGGIVFDAVVQAFFTRGSYHRVMSALRLNSYSVAQTERLLATQGHAGPWNARWVPTPAQLHAYYARVRAGPSFRTATPAHWPA